MVISHQWFIIIKDSSGNHCDAVVWLTEREARVFQEQWSHLDAIEVVHSQNGAPLVLVADEAEAFGLPRLLVTHQVDVDNLPIPDRIMGGKGQ